MNPQSSPHDLSFRSGRPGSRRLAGVSLLLLSFVAPCLVAQQRVRQANPRAETSQGGAEAPALLELQKRRNDAASAQQSGDPEAVAGANRLLIAFCLRQMGQLRLRQAAYPQAIELYRHSLDFEDIPDTRVDLAIADLYYNKLDEALAETAKVLARDPKNPRAWNVQGKAWMKKQDPQKAAESLTHAIEVQPDLEAAYALGISLLAAKQKDKADDVFGEMLKALGDSGPLRVLFARAYRDANFMDDTVRELKQAVALDTTTPHAHYFLGLSYLILNEWAPTPDCKREFLEEVRHHPRDYLSNYFLGVIASIAKDIDESNRYLRVASEIDPASPESWLYLGLNAYARQNNAQAEQYLRKATDLAAGQDAEAHYLIRKGYVVLGRILVNSGRKEEAQPYLRKARELQNLALNESMNDVSAVQAESGVGTGAAVAPFVPKLEKEIALPARGDPAAQPDAFTLARANLTPQEMEQAKAQEKQLRAILASSFNDLATSEAVRGQFDAALGNYQEAERWEPDFPGLRRNLGTAAFRLQKYAETIRVLAKEPLEKPYDAPTRAMLGMAYFASDDYANTVRTIAPLGEAAKRDPAVGYAWASSLTKLGNLKEATGVLLELEKIELDPQTLLLFGQLWVEIGDYAHSVETLHRALQKDPRFLKAHYYSGLAQLRAERPAQAIEEFKDELKLTPDDPDATYSLGYAYLQVNQREEAIGLFQSVIARFPGYSKAQYELGKIMLDEGNVKEAIIHLEKAAQLKPEADYIHYQLQAAYRKDLRIQDADRELQLYKETKARNRQLDLPKPVQEP